MENREQGAKRAGRSDAWQWRSWGRSGLILGLLVGAASQVRADEALLNATFDSDAAPLSLEGRAYDGGGSIRLRGGTPDLDNVVGSAITPALDATGFASVQLCFRALVRGLDAGEAATVGYSADGGLSYRALEFSPGTSWGEHCFELEGAQDRNAVLVAFRLEGANSLFEVFALDEVIVLGRGEGGPGDDDPGDGDTGEGDPGDGDAGEGDGSGDVATAQQLRGNGPYSVGRYQPGASATSGFGSGTLHYPHGAPGERGILAVVPGYAAQESSIRWLGPRMASWGFVVITFMTNSPFDGVRARSSQLRSALDAVIAEGERSGSPIFGRVDAGKQAVAGWSMGGGGSLDLADGDAQIGAVIPLAPWELGGSFRGLTVPTLIVACENDTVAAPSRHAERFYSGIPNSTDKAYLEIDGGGHFCVGSGSPDTDVIGQYAIAWLKRFLDGESGYDVHLCRGRPVADADVSAYASSCPF